MNPRRGYLEEPWRDRAQCLTADPEIFFPSADEDDDENSITTREAKRICHTCPVITPCLDWALWLPEPHGVWGGLSAPERMRLRLKLARRLQHVPMQEAS